MNAYRESLSLSLSFHSSLLACDILFEIIVLSNSGIKLMVHFSFQMPGTIMAMGRLNRPSIMVYGGTIKVRYMLL